MECHGLLSSIRDNADKTKEEFGLHAFAARLTRDLTTDLSYFTLHPFKIVLEEEISPLSPAYLERGLC